MRVRTSLGVEPDITLTKNKSECLLSSRTGPKISARHPRSHLPWRRTDIALTKSKSECLLSSRTRPKIFAGHARPHLPWRRSEPLQRHARHLKDRRLLPALES
jgi:hypothetical protein